MIRNKQDFWSGILYLGCGLFFSIFAMSYSMGTTAKMGPGYFPFWLGVILSLIGAYIALTSISKKAEVTEIQKMDWKTILTILGAVCAFGFLLQPMGLYIALFALVIISAFASHEFTWKGALINAVVLITMCYVMFVYALKLQFPLYPAFLGL
jgi:Tripartite tricarboxylate transporter TctB family